MSIEMLQNKFLLRAFEVCTELHDLPVNEHDLFRMYQEAFFMACHELVKLKNRENI